MSNIQLTRIIEPILSTRGRHTCIENAVVSMGVSFFDANDNQVSLAFDGRFESEAIGGRMVQEKYSSYSDCPVINGDGVQSGPVTDLQAIRFLRDALNKLDLDE